MCNHRSRIYVGFIVLWGLCAVVLGLQAGMAGACQSDRSALIGSGKGSSMENSMDSGTGIADQTDPFSVLIFREPKGKRKLEPRADSSEWQVILRWALVAC
jgi:hypothetical protein